MAVFGGRHVGPEVETAAERVGRAVARRSSILLTGARHLIDLRDVDLGRAPPTRRRSAIPSRPGRLPTRVRRGAGDGVVGEAGAQRVPEWLSGVPGWLAVLLVVAVVPAEPALIVGMVLPSAGAAVSLGFLSSLVVVPLAGAVVAVALAAVVGDGPACRSGRQRGMARAAATGRLARRTQHAWARIGQWYERTGPWATWKSPCPRACPRSHADRMTPRRTTAVELSVHGNRITA